MILQFS